MTDRFLSLVQRSNDINYEYRTDIVHNNMIEDTYSVVCKLETQLIIKPRIIIQKESGERSMNKEEYTSCRVKVVGRDDKNRQILEFFGDEADCGNVLSVLAGQVEIIIRTKKSAY